MTKWQMLTVSHHVGIPLSSHATERHRRRSLKNPETLQMRLTVWIKCHMPSGLEMWADSWFNPTVSRNLLELDFVSSEFL